MKFEISDLLNPQSAIRNPQSAKSAIGFTLAEMLVAVAILMILMAGFTMLFTGSVRTVRSAMQQTDAYDLATGALSSIKLDLMSGFNAAGIGNKFSFYGTPIGMTFVGSVKNLSDYATPNPGEADYHLARVTYVLYHNPSVLELYFPGGFLAQDGSLHDGFTHRMLRYVEPNYTDLDTFPVKWNEAYVTNSESTSLADVLEAETLELTLAGHTGEYVDAYKRARKCEFWIRMLAGGDNEVPNAWQFPEICLGRAVNVLDFVLTDAVATPVPPFTIEGYPVPSYNDFPFSGPALFDYDYARPGDYGQKTPNNWWNDPHSANCQNGYGFCADTCLPEVVSASIWLMFEAPYVGAPDFQKLFTMQINLPTGYIRQGIISGFVRLGETCIPVDRLSMEVWPEVGTPTETDASGYYSVAVPYGWNGRITVTRPADPDEEAPCYEGVQFRDYTNVTTHIENQNYAVQ